jgi:N-acetylglucosamine malate deacetylase 1
MRILAIGAHPDDLELSCYGTLAKYAQNKENQIFVSTVCRGNAGTLKYKAEEIVKIRKEEASKAAELIGAEYIPLCFNDGEVFFNEKFLSAFLKLIRKTNPDVIITHSEEERYRHNDHFFTYQLVLSASIWATHHNITIEPEYPAIEKAAAIFSFPADSSEGITHYVDITDTFEVKKKALSCHKSQLEFTNQLTGYSLFEGMEITAKKRGYECGVGYAEVFKELVKYPHVKPARLLP